MSASARLEYETVSSPVNDCLYICQKL